VFKSLYCLCLIALLALVSACEVPEVNLTVVNGSGSGTYYSGTLVEIEAILPNENMKFYKWEGANFEDAYSLKTKLKMPGYHTIITAIFLDKYNQFILRVEGGTGSGIYKVDDIVAIQASRPANTQFLNWYGDFNLLANANLPDTTLQMPAQDVYLKAQVVKHPNCSDTLNKLKFVNYPVANSSCLPPNKQGITDQDYGDAPMGLGPYSPLEKEDILNSRYAVYKNQINAGMRIYNFWWNFVEHPNHVAKPSLNEVSSCAGGYIRIPFDENEKNLFGFKKFRCINVEALKKMDKLIGLDKRHGMQSAVVLYSAPKKYISSGCENYVHLKTMGCVPRDDSMDDYEDYVRVLATRYNGECKLESCKSQNPQGAKISHFVVWNEVDHSIWNRDGSLLFDISQGLNSPKLQSIMDKYAKLLIRTHSAMKGNITGAMIYASFTANMQGPGLSYGGVQIGVYNVLDYIWNKVGLNIPWSVAFHPYGERGNVYQALNYLEDLLKYQRGKLEVATGKNYQELELKNYPQMYIFLSEQGHYRDPKVASDLDSAAKYICLAHKRQYQFANFMIGSTHNYFYSTDDENSANGCYLQGACYGLIRNTQVDIDFANLDNEVTGSAYLATSLNNWTNSDEHYCCVNHKMGCLDKSIDKSEYRVMGALEGIDLGIIKGWAFDKDNPTRNATIRLKDENSKVLEVKTGMIRIDINQTYFIPGNHGFAIKTDELYQKGLKKGYIYISAIDHSGIDVYLGKILY